MRARLAAFLFALLVCIPPAIPRRGDAQAGAVPPASAPFGSAPVARSRRGVVASATAEATEAGAATLAAGGNAVDAAGATALALAVTYPSAGNLAGGGFAVGRTPGGELWALDFRETAPAGTWRNSFLGPDGKARPRASTTGGLAVGTPGTVRGLETLHRRYGKLPWARLFAPAIRLARDGFRVPPGLHGILAAYETDLARDPAASKIFLAEGHALAAGSLLVQEDLARTLETVAAKGADGFHRGGIARKIAAFVQSAGGVLTEEDIAGYQAEWRPPFVFDDGPYRLVTMPLPSSGGFLLAFDVPGDVVGRLRTLLPKPNHWGDVEEFNSASDWGSDLRISHEQDGKISDITMRYSPAGDSFDILRRTSTPSPALLTTAKTASPHVLHVTSVPERIATFSARLHPAYISVPRLGAVMTLPSRTTPGNPIAMQS